jgi:hypothetical protein
VLGSGAVAPPLARYRSPLGTGFALVRPAHKVLNRELYTDRPA